MKEKILDILVQTGWDKKLNDIQQMADDYAIEFEEWLRINYYDNGEFWTKWNSDDNTHSSKELLEIFKKEKYV
ncbi:hypothetical protein [Flavobacterium sp.]|uniref:hypothetical protein n=1 Tax=Flavobacterium sp. TaxID=239 RepID=UPI0025F1DFE1|nr:hypothetical protein [Flavobacterium sp.]